ncbi:hypothetical protein SR42_14980 [Clostridium botulinum]|uniref:hypothetical protein n=1 Tax=Clostridium botulinum TaxID=1491 RepID=UPI000596DE61|nr:hypothetical protein [Clostridium botulinum]KIL06876.1 hypothetical protein SR42_14980 [Clostridium botulinum]MBY6915467.1 hypothetical protein [Clostridium botulinum]NFL84356.1 hypothetical protein [Clostridium botulinum]NFN13212.1 hypothetical protein [Clostridium botulinum]NFO38179.1 hypothetical protein [Clostridium botulinum]
MRHGEYFTIYKEFRILATMLFYIIMSVTVFNIFTVTNKMQTKDRIKIIVSILVCLVLIILY